MLQPKRTKFRKAHKGRIHGLAKGGFTLSFGGFGLKALEPERVTARQIDSESGHSGVKTSAPARARHCAANWRSSSVIGSTPFR